MTLKQPYIFHLDATAALLESYGEQAQVVGYLHDVIEDTSVTELEIAEKFSLFISRCVALLTDAPGDSRKERKSKTYARLASVEGDEQLALIVKTADRLANVRACVKDGNQRLLAIYQE
jgi:guanosine-3',5'-bis(diphosphate) 3'-pyrophosphohydrolase